MLEAFGLSDSGCVRPNNEDCYLIAPEKGLYVVADGMGGAQAGERASKLAVDTLAGFVAKSGQADAEMLTQAFQEANNQVMNAASNDVTLEGMGTTLVAALEAGPEIAGSAARDEIPPGLRSLHVGRLGRRGRHFILYRPAVGEVVEVLRILHDAMDLARHISV